MTVYPPLSHFLRIQKIYDRLTLKRVLSFPDIETLFFSGWSESRNRERQDEQTGRKNFVAGLHVRFIPDFNLYKFTVFPGQVLDSAQVIRHIRQFSTSRLARGTVSSVQVSLNDPRCPAFSRLLEDYGYRFCGILPEQDAHDYVVYSDFEDSSLTDKPLHHKEANSFLSHIISAYNRGVVFQHGYA